MEHLGFGSLLLQILLVAVATFVVSALFWVVAPWHKTEFKALPDEDAVRKVLQAQGVNDGQWRIPFSPRKEDWKTPEFQARFATGPVGIFQFEKPHGLAMGPRLLKTFIFLLVIAAFTAAALVHILVAGAIWQPVFHLAFLVSFGCHAFGHAQDAIWFGKSWRRVLFQALDSFFYAIITAAIFAAMWPGR